MLLEFLLSHENMTTLVDAIKKVNVDDVIDWVSQSWDQVVVSTTVVAYPVRDPRSRIIIFGCFFLS
jgi:hypothetical protein